MLEFFCLYWLLCLENPCELSIKFAAKKKRENFPLQPRKKKEKIIFILLVFFFFRRNSFFFFFSTLTTSACQQLIRVHKHQLALHASNKRKKKQFINYSSLVNIN